MAVTLDHARHDIQVLVPGLLRSHRLLVEGHTRCLRCCSNGKLVFIRSSFILMLKVSRGSV